MSSKNNFELWDFYTIGNLIVSAVKKKCPIDVNEKETEAWLRNAVDRYYYVVFLLFRDAFLADPDLRSVINHNGSDHGAIQRILKERLPKELSGFVCIIRDMRGLRNRVDYNTGSGSKIKLTTVESCRDQVEKIRDNLDLIMKKIR